jgi:hypothetical protein
MIADWWLLGFSSSFKPHARVAGVEQDSERATFVVSLAIPS